MSQKTTVRLPGFLVEFFEIQAKEQGKSVDAVVTEALWDSVDLKTPKVRVTEVARAGGGEVVQGVEWD